MNFGFILSAKNPTKKEEIAQTVDLGIKYETASASVSPWLYIIETKLKIYPALQV